MNKRLRLRHGVRGMTLIEVLVTIGVLSVVLALVLPMYSTSYETIRSRDALLTIIHESDRLMDMIGNDIRKAHEILCNAPSDMKHVVVATMKVHQIASDSSLQEQAITYALDAQRPNRLLRIVQQQGNEKLITTELSRNIESIQMTSETQTLFNIQLRLQQTVAGKKVALQTISSYAMR
ncbi:Tfp pilus assembly protein PilW [Candidatus Vecturithrix granuli]|uniref:Tfp pilus assembly protein PilW n=1 Tax=Vecturithrix granuli TaxID=1499967 RepID=A0A0S6W9Z1_VECG1|nr:Tfp pilus assembly protein PilW [Candidatus Vecturithrix granuli]